MLHMKKVTTAHSGTDKKAHLDKGDIQRERYRVFIEDVADGFYETDLRGTFRYFNDALCRIFGYSRSRIKGSNFRDFMDDKNAASAFKTV